MCENPKLLTYYSLNLDLCLETDVIGTFISMALVQSKNNDRELLYPIAYGSKILNDVEK